MSSFVCRSDSLVSRSLSLEKGFESAPFSSTSTSRLLVCPRRALTSWSVAGIDLLARLGDVPLGVSLRRQQNRVGQRFGEVGVGAT